METNNTQTELSRNSRHSRHHHHRPHRHPHNRENSYHDRVNGNDIITNTENNLESFSCMLLPLKRKANIVDVSATLHAIDQLSLLHYSDTTSMTNTSSITNTHENYASTNIENNKNNNNIKNNGEVYNEQKANDRTILPHPYKSTNESNESNDNNNNDNNKNQTYYSYNNYINKENKNENEPLLLSNHEMHFGQISSAAVPRNYNYQPTVTRRVNVSTPSLQVINNADDIYANPFLINENGTSSHILSLSTGRRRRSSSRKRVTTPSRVLLSFHDKTEDDLNSYNKNSSSNNQRMSTKYYNSHPTWRGAQHKIKDRRLRRIKAYDLHLKEMNKRKQILEHEEQHLQEQELEEEDELGEVLSLKANNLNEDEVQSTHSSIDNNNNNTDEMWEDSNQDKKDTMNNNISNIPLKVTNMSNVECTRLRNTTMCKLLDLYDEIEELYSSRANMTKQMTRAMCVDPRWTRSVAGMMQQTTQPTKEQQMALKAVNETLELLYHSATELVATYLTPEEKRYLGLNSHHFQTQRERKSNYQYTSAKMLQKPTMTKVATREKTIKSLSGAKSNTPIAPSGKIATNEPTNNKANVKPMSQLKVNTLHPKNNNLTNNNVKNKFAQNKPHVETTKGLLHLTPVKTNAEVKSVNFDMSHVNATTEEQKENSNYNNYITGDDKKQKELEARNNIFTVQDNNNLNNNNINTLGEYAYKSNSFNNKIADDNNNNNDAYEGVNLNTGNSFNYLKKFEEAMTSEEPSSYNKLTSAEEKNNENNVFRNENNNNNVTAESTTLDSVTPIAILPMVTKPADNATLTTLPNTENDTLSVNNSNNNINKDANNDELATTTLQSNNIEKKPSAPLVDESKQHNNHHSNANAHSRFQNLLIDSDSDSSME